MGLSGSSDRPNKSNKHKLGVLLFSVLSVAGHAAIVERKEISQLTSDIHAKLSKVIETVSNESDIQFLKDCYPKLYEKLKNDLKESNADKQINEARVKERSEYADAFLKAIRKDYATMKIDDIIWKLEYFFQGPEDVTFEKAHKILLEQLGAVEFSDSKQATWTDLEAIHRTFVPQGKRNDIKSSAVEFLASPMDSNLQNCSAAAKTLLLAILSKYPQMRNSLYLQKFNDHVRLIAEIDGVKKVFEWENIVDFPDLLTKTKRNYIVPVDIYFGLVAGNTDKILMDKIVFFGPKVDANELNIPGFSNETLPRFKTTDRLGSYAEVEEKVDTPQENFEIKAEMPAYDLIIPAKPAELEAFRKTPEVMNILIKLDQISLSELKDLGILHLILNSNVTFSGHKKMSDELVDFIVANLDEAWIYFEDIEEIEDTQMKALFLKNKTTDRHIIFKNLRSINSKSPVKEVENFVEINLLESEFGHDAYADKNIGKSKNTEPDYSEIDVLFEAITSMSPSIANWLGKRSGKITFGPKANLTAQISTHLQNFKGKLVVQNPHAVSLVKGLERRSGKLVYNANDADLKMIEALAGYNGELIGVPPFDDNKIINDQMLSAKLGFMADMRNIGKKRGEIVLEIDHFDKTQTYKQSEGIQTARNTTIANVLYEPGNAFKIHIKTVELTHEHLAELKEHQGPLVLEFRYYNGNKANIDNLFNSIRDREAETTITLPNSAWGEQELFEQISGFKSPISIVYFSIGNKEIQERFNDQIIKDLERKNDANVTFLIDDLLTPDKFDVIIDKMNSKSRKIKFQIRRQTHGEE